MRMIGEVALKEKPEDTRNIKKITSKWDPKHRECGQRTLFPTLPLLGTADSGMVGWSLPGGPWEGVKSIPNGTTYHRTARCIEPPVQGLPFMLGRERIIYNWPPLQAPLGHLLRHAGWGCLLLPRSYMGTLLLDLCPEAENTFATFEDHVYEVWRLWKNGNYTRHTYKPT